MKVGKVYIISLIIAAFDFTWARFTREPTSIIKMKVELTLYYIVANFID